MDRGFWALLMFVTASAFGQTPQPAIRVEVTSAAGPVPDAEITAGGQGGRTGADGVSVIPAALGHVDIRVTKEGFFPASASLDIDAAREWTVQVELQLKEKQKEDVTV